MIAPEQFYRWLRSEETEALMKFVKAEIEACQTTNVLDFASLEKTALRTAHLQGKIEALTQILNCKQEIMYAETD